jgi:hypothetical protein
MEVEVAKTSHCHATYYIIEVEGAWKWELARMTRLPSKSKLRRRVIKDLVLLPLGTSSY